MKWEFILYFIHRIKRRQQKIYLKNENPFKKISVIFCEMVSSFWNRNRQYSNKILKQKREKNDKR